MKLRQKVGIVLFLAGALGYGGSQYYFNHKYERPPEVARISELETELSGLVSKEELIQNPGLAAYYSNLQKEHDRLMSQPEIKKASETDSRVSIYESLLGFLAGATMAGGLVSLRIRSKKDAKSSKTN